MMPTDTEAFQKKIIQNRTSTSLYFLHHMKPEDQENPVEASKKFGSNKVSTHYVYFI